MNTYIICAVGPDGEKCIRWIKAEDYQKAKAQFFYLYPEQSIESMWLKVR